MKRYLVLVSAVFTLTSCKFLEDPKCPLVSPKSPQDCQGHLSNCWSPGVRDTDCPGNGLCCYDGCANTCYTHQISSPSILQQQIMKQKTPSFIPPPAKYLPLAPPSIASASPLLTHPPPQTTQQLTPRTSCPSVTALPLEQCGDRLSTCWSVGVPDLDCPNWGLCCFDGCANVCLGNTPIKPPRDVKRPNPCAVNPCGSGAVSTPSRDRCVCSCPSGTVGNPQTACHQGECLVDDDCSLDKACKKYNCVDPCLSGTCRTTDLCKVVIHKPICGYSYDQPNQEPRDLFVIGERYLPSQPVETEHKVIVGGKYKEEIVGRHQETVTVGEEYTNDNTVVIGESWQGPEGFPDTRRMRMMDSSGLPVIGIGRDNKNRVLRSRARKKVYA